MADCFLRPCLLCDIMDDGDIPKEATVVDSERGAGGFDDKGCAVSAKLHALSVDAALLLQLALHACQFRVFRLRSSDLRSTTPKYLRCRIAKQPLGGGIPVGDSEIFVHPDDRIADVREQMGLEGELLFGAPTPAQIRREQAVHAHAVHRQALDREFHWSANAFAPPSRSGALANSSVAA